MSCNCIDCEYKEKLYLLTAQMSSNAEQLEAILDRIEKKVKRENK
jgi:hypothetical protein